MAWSAALGVFGLVTVARRARGGHRLRARRLGLGLGPEPARIGRGPARLVADRAPRTHGVLFAAGALFVAAGAVGGVGLLLLVVAATVGTAAAALVHRRAREVRRVDDALPAVLESLAGSVRSGASLPLALRDAARTADGVLASDLADIITSVDTGVPLAAALGTWSEARPSARVRLAVAAMTLALQCGGAEARTLDGVAATLRDRLAVEHEVVALSAQARSSAVVMIAAPAVFLLITGFADPGLWPFLLRTPLGFACLVLGIALDAAGGVWMWWIARSVS